MSPALSTGLAGRANSTPPGVSLLLRTRWVRNAGSASVRSTLRSAVGYAWGEEGQGCHLGNEPVGWLGRAFCDWDMTQQSLGAKSLAGLHMQGHLRASPGTQVCMKAVVGSMGPSGGFEPISFSTLGCRLMLQGDAFWVTEVLMSYCCITNHPPNLMAQNDNILLSVTVTVVQEFRKAAVVLTPGFTYSWSQTVAEAARGCSGTSLSLHGCLYGFWED